jgi:DNA recombination protein Rad52
MSPGFAKSQLKKLATELDPRRIQRRQQDGRALSYIEGWFVLAEANRIFGYDGWDREMVHCERVFERKSRDTTECGYLARVRVRVRAQSTTITREGTGFGLAIAATPGEAHERALKAAETDATKRALVTFGSRFGLMLYDKERRMGSVSQSRAVSNVSQPPEWPGTSESAEGLLSRPRVNEAVAGSSSRSATSEAAPGPSSLPATGEGAVTDAARAVAKMTPTLSKSVSSPPPNAKRAYHLIASDGTAIEVLSPEGFCTALRQLIVAARSPEELARLRWNNQPTLSQLRGLFHLVTRPGRHYADLLEQLIAKRLEQFARQDRVSSSSCPEHKTSEGVVAEPPKVLDAVAVPVPPRELSHPFVPAPRYPLAKLQEILAANTAGGAEAQTVTASTGAPPPDAEPNVDLCQSQQAVLPTRRSQITAGFAIDKSALAIPSERRLRSKAHRMFVASKPCLICEQLPCHAHHITFAQPRGVSQKVSDEFTVPLCVVHHNELHAFHNEASWWRNQKIEPLPIANALWRESVTGE